MCYIHLPAELAASQSEVSSLQQELTLERHQASLLQAQLGTLHSQLSSRGEELAAAVLSHDRAREKLGSAGDSVQQSRQEMLSLKAEVGLVACCVYTG